MLYAVEQGPVEKAIFERHVRYGFPLPEKIQNAPALFSGLSLYFTAFNRLSTTRNSVMGLGQISYFSCTKYCDEHEIYGDQREDFIYIILAMDEAYLKYMAENKPKKEKGDDDGKLQ